MSGATKNLAKYWKLYGGFAALVRSLYFRVALGFTVLSFPLWMENAWVETAFSVLPSLLSLSLAGYAILISFGDDKFKRLLAGSTAENGRAPFLEINATFVHFIVVQTLAVLSALLMKAWTAVATTGSVRYSLILWLYDHHWLPVLKYPFAAFAFFLFVYGIILIVAAALSVFQIGQWFDTYQGIQGAQGQTRPQGHERGVPAARPVTPPPAHQPVASTEPRHRISEPVQSVAEPELAREDEDEQLRSKS